MNFKKLLISILIIYTACILESCDKKQLQTEASWKKSKSERLLTDKYISIADSLNKKLDYKKAYYYFYKAKKTAEFKKDTSRVIYSLFELANMHYYQADFVESESILTQVSELLKNRKDHYYNFTLYMIQGNIYNSNYDYENAKYYYEKALKYDNVDDFYKILIKNNLAVIFLKKNNYKKAAEILEPLIAKKELINDDTEYSRVLSNLGYCYFKLGNPKALEYLNKSLEIKTKIKDIGIDLSCFYLSEYYQKKDPKKATDYAELAYQLATKSNIINDQLFYLKQLISLSSGEKSKEYSLRYITLDDSLTKMRQMAKNQFAKIKYDYTSEKVENQELKSQRALELEQQKYKNLIFYSVTLIGMLSMLYLYQSLKNKNKRDKIKSSYNTETRIAKKLHDELANDVFRTIAFVETSDLSSTKNKETILNHLDTIYSRTRNISIENSTIDTGINFIYELKEMITAFNTENTNILANGIQTINWSELASNKKIIIYRVIQELLVNMKKHSLSSIAVITFKNNKKKLQIDYSDNGVGVALEKIIAKNGLQNIENRIQTINGTITFESEINKGFKTSISIPI